MNLEIVRHLSLHTPRDLLADIELPSIKDVNLGELKRRGISNIIFDLDGTLVSENSNTLHKTIAATYACIRAEFSCCILSNSAGNLTNDKDSIRAKQIEKILKLPVIRTKQLKPHPAAYERALNFMHATPSNTLLISDKRYDIAGARRKGMLTILIEPIDRDAEPFSGKMERIVENFLAAMIKAIR